MTTASSETFVSPRLARRLVVRWPIRWADRVGCAAATALCGGAGGAGAVSHPGRLAGRRVARVLGLMAVLSLACMPLGVSR